MPTTHTVRTMNEKLILIQKKLQIPLEIIYLIFEYLEPNSQKIAFKDNYSEYMKRKFMFYLVAPFDKSQLCIIITNKKSFSTIEFGNVGPGSLPAVPKFGHISIYGFLLLHQNKIIENCLSVRIYDGKVDYVSNKCSENVHKDTIQLFCKIPKLISLEVIEYNIYVINYMKYKKIIGDLVNFDTNKLKKYDDNCFEDVLKESIIKKIICNGSAKEKVDEMLKIIKNGYVP